MGINKFMRIRVRLDVSLQLKRKKRIQIGKERTVYARFQYEKLSLFCFICGKLGHGESFCLIRTRIDPSKIIFGWDISLRAVGRRRNPMKISIKDDNKWRNESSINLIGEINVSGPMDVVLTEENELLFFLEGKKRQQIVEVPKPVMGKNTETDSLVLTASSAG
ncbi:hypothetical protein J1N35_017763 [Gossypium stocksii]|uniref:Zinc knuckle CX2CX4HX4C domain-containing protein n=1 Tax=Gossypium stocksii TaxID=47602 RepID=A0A9D4A6I5_9ROSI|nr:hypothetical protein J1N35_017763 [Gossypium stocksii]